MNLYQYIEWNNSVAGLSDPCPSRCLLLLRISTTSSTTYLHCPAVASQTTTSLRSYPVSQVLSVSPFLAQCTRIVHVTSRQRCARFVVAVGRHISLTASYTTAQPPTTTFLHLAIISQSLSRRRSRPGLSLILRTSTTEKHEALLCTPATDVANGGPVANSHNLHFWRDRPLDRWQFEGHL
jgi:hypothetical protein